MSEAQFSKMIKLKTVVAAGLAALLAISTIAPVSAARIYNPDTNTWEDASAVAARGRRGSSIKREVVAYQGKYKPGTIVVETSERRLYLVLEDGKAMKY